MQDAIKIDNKESNKKIVNVSELGSVGVDYTLIGDTFQALLVQLDHNEKIVGRSGSMSWMTTSTKMTSANGFDGIRMVNFECPYTVSVICLAPRSAGKIIAARIGAEQSIVMRREKFLCTEEGVKFIDKKKIGKYPFWIVSGVGVIHFTSLGESIVYDLGAEDELLIDEENLIAFESSVTCNLQRVQGSLRQIIYAGEGYSLFKVKGPGKVWLQTVKPQEIK